MAATTREALKRKREEEEHINGLDTQKLSVAPITLSHEYVAPDDYSQPASVDAALHGVSRPHNIAPVKLQ